MWSPFYWTQALMSCKKVKLIHPNAGKALPCWSIHDNWELCDFKVFWKTKQIWGIGHQNSSVIIKIFFPWKLGRKKTFQKVFFQSCFRCLSGYFLLSFFGRDAHRPSFGATFHHFPSCLWLSCCIHCLSFSLLFYIHCSFCCFSSGFLGRLLSDQVWSSNLHHVFLPRLHLILVTNFVILSQLCVDLTYKTNTDWKQQWTLCFPEA